MKLRNKTEWNDLVEGGYYKIIYKEDESNIQDEGYLDLFNVFKLKTQPRDWDIRKNETPKNYRFYTFEYLNLFDGLIGIGEKSINKVFVKEIYELSHDDLIFEIMDIWADKQEDINKSLLMSRVHHHEAYLQLHFKAIYNNVIQIIGAMSLFFTGIYEILPSESLKDAIMIEIPLKEDNA